MWLDSILSELWMGVQACLEYGLLPILVCRRGNCGRTSQANREYDSEAETMGAMVNFPVEAGDCGLYTRFD